MTCPIVRTHPAVIAQASATAAVQCEGRFTLGVGTGEALNEHVTGERWPSPKERRDMLEEAIDVIRALHTGQEVNHRGRYYTVDRARLYTVPDQPVPIYVSAFGPAALDLAVRAGDGFCTVSPDTEMVRRYRRSGGADRCVQGGLKVCWAESEENGIRTAHRLWRNELLPGQLPSTLNTPADYSAASTLIAEEMTAAQFPCGPDPARHVAAVREFADAGFDEVYVQQIGPDQDRFFDAWHRDVLPSI
ncbi:MULTISPECIES: TIGR03557 family F420-dependent LLM class oxidoreductase [Amycolatopsis]|uniref:TIGR03557 family F420-dependent LLM class oxidoreductase n=1 Tax=Amycolatopsis sp. M39 TaxID=1825094 RepID=UPI0007DEFDE6|nr:TIGR03557 family F420-dependent LLM class oxidoreductase [Amycolatopsis sp. M39]OAP20852.1 F420-dependent glucose-6-phosphate dehydrogenase [Amycolatopsis sp. M39]